MRGKIISEEQWKAVKKLIDNELKNDEIAALTHISKNTVWKIRKSLTYGTYCETKPKPETSKSDDVAADTLKQDIDKYIYQTMLEHVAQTLDAILAEQQEHTKLLNALVEAWS